MPEIEPAIATSAAMIITGNELLSGKIADSNLVELARTLRSIGVLLSRAIVLQDERDEVARVVKDWSSRHDVVFTSGGIGPTHDDVTIEAVAQAYGVEVDLHPELETLLKRVYKDKLTKDHLRMGLVPNGARLVTTPDISWPTVVMGNVWILPGVPELFRMKLAVVRAHVRGPSVFASGSVYTKLDEGQLKPLLDEVVTRFPGVMVGSYPKWFDDDYKTKLTFDASDSHEMQRARDAFVALLPPGEPQRVD